jgi:intracellular sulfur oxidation DsrE/DsrF family protein
MQILTKSSTWLLALVCLGLSSQLWAAPAEKPFAEKKVVLQISDDDASKQTLVLNVASNLIKHYGPDQVHVEIVAFGPGLRLLFADNSNAGRIDNLAENSGVRFSACMNTMQKVTQNLGYEPKLDANAAPVDAGVVRILDLVSDGYVLIKP